jgi:RNA polymerase sigma factor (sigma-70 family)
LRRAVVNRIRDLIRGSNRVGLEPLADVEPRDWKPSPLEAAIMRQQLDGFLAALQRLKPADRQVIVWRIELGYTAEEIAAKLGKSTAAAGMTISRATARLAKEMRLVLDPPV